MGTILRFVANVGISMLWIYVFHSLGWIIVRGESGTPDFWLTILSIAFVGMLVGVVFAFLWIVSGFLTCGIMFLAYPVFYLVYGFVSLWGVAEYTDLMSINATEWWVWVLMGIAYGLIRLPAAPATTYRYTSSRW
ncbi:hypothetical protein KA078_00715 [Candidatus Woesebacteria bacterium]|nr:hypothetical protein [Candidatus Woesebacteria bacterium]